MTKLQGELTEALRRIGLRDSANLFILARSKQSLVENIIKADTMIHGARQIALAVDSATYDLVCAETEPVLALLDKFGEEVTKREK